jgi:membrane-associated phospholipid phosphatase
LALQVYLLLSVAPSRLAHVGLGATINTGTGGLFNGHLATLFYNPLAAMPSLHCGFALAVSLALIRSNLHRSARLISALGAPLVVLAVLATGNHYALDVIAGLAITIAGFALGARLRVHLGLRAQR